LITPELIGITVYVIFMICLGFHVSKRIKSDSDYFLAGRSLGPLLATFSIFATWFGAESCIGTASKVYSNGFGGSLTDPFGYVLCIFLMGLLFSKVLWNRNITTIADVLGQRFCKTTERITAILIIPGSIIWAGAQIKGFGQVLHVNMSVDAQTATTIAAIVVLIYTITGGLLADAYTDLLQGVVLVLGMIAVFFFLIYSVGGFGAAFEMMREQNQILSAARDPMPWSVRFETLLVPVLGSILAQELVSRVVASRSSKVAYRSCMAAGWIYLMVGIVPIVIGLLGSRFIPGLADSDSITPALAKVHMNYFLYVIFIGALISAILSTVDSTLLAVSAIATHNLYPNYKDLSERKKVILARAGVLLSGILAYAIAFSGESIATLTELASSAGGPIILTIACFALFSKFGNSFNALTSIVIGIIAWAMFEFYVEVNTPVILTMCMTIIAYIGASALKKMKDVYPITQSGLRKFIAIFWH